MPTIKPSIPSAVATAKLSYSESVTGLSASIKGVKALTSPSKGRGDAPDRTHIIYPIWNSEGLPKEVVEVLPKSMLLSEIDLGKMLASAHLTSVANLEVLSDMDSDEECTLFVELHKRIVGKEYENYAGKTFTWKADDKRAEGDVVFTPELAPVCFKLGEATTKAMKAATIASEVAVRTKLAEVEREERKAANIARMRARMLSAATT